MDLLQNRRKVVTYGKSRRKLHIESIFGDQASSKSQIDARNPFDQTVYKTSITKKRNPIEIAIQQDEVISHSNGQDTRTASPNNIDHGNDSSDSSSSQSSQQDGSQSSSILDLLDSDDEACAQQLQPVEVKRRKITPLNTRPGPTIATRAQKSKPGTTTVARNKQKTKTSHATQRRSTPSVLDAPSAPAERISPQTPKARRILQRTDERSRPIASPSQLGLTSLRLTPEKKEISSSPEQRTITPRRVRQRLTDLLDAPETGAKSQAASPRSRHKTPVEMYESSTIDPTHDSKHPALTSASFADVSSSMKVSKVPDESFRFTYAKERSHLSDMVDEIEQLKSTQALNLEATVPVNSSNLLRPEAIASQDLEDSDDASAASVVKSIHELRQAGINNRFERDMETLFEDLEPRSSPSKALKVQALLQLNQQLKGANFARQFVEAGLTRRLARCAQLDTDTVSAVLTTFALSEVFPLDRVSPGDLLSAFQALVRLAPGMLIQTQPFHKVVIDRKQNLSKALTRDLVEFGKAVKVETLGNSVLWTPQSVALFVLEHLLRTIRKSRTVSIDLPTSLFNQILEILSVSIEEYEAQRRLVEVALTVLEYSAVSSASRTHENQAETTTPNYSLLGDAVTRLMQCTSVEERNVKSIALRLVVSLTNDEPVVCTSLAETDLIPAVFSIIEQELPPLSESADSGDEFDASKLDSVIMALGCLLNLADCSSEARDRMYAPSKTGVSNVHWLVSMFNQRAGRAQDV
jgi:hypothetical protein